MGIKLIVNADDYGFSKSTNEAVKILAENHKISSTTVMVNMPFGLEIEQLLKFDKLGVGLHLNLTQGKPIADPIKVSSLIDANGNFFPYKLLQKKAYFGKIKTTHFQIEVEAQFELLKNLVGDRLTHIDSHQWIHKIPFLAKSLVNWKQNFRQTEIIGLRSPKRYFIVENGVIERIYSLKQPKRAVINLYENILHSKFSQHFKLPDGEILAINRKKLKTIKLLTDYNFSHNSGKFELSCHPAVDLDGIPNTKLLYNRVLEFELMQKLNWGKEIDLVNFGQIG